MQRFFIDPTAITGDHFLIKDQKIIHQISRVLRMQSGDEFVLLDNLGNEFSARITKIDKTTASGEIASRENKKDPVKRKITLYQGLLKKDNFELVLQKCTELGVSEFFPVITSRTIKIKSEIPERWQTIIHEASEQSGRVFIPKINEPKNFSDAVQQAAARERQNNFIAHEKIVGTNKFADRQIYWYEDLPEKVGIFIGPEGGFSDSEVAFANNHGITSVSLGGLVLRAETAAIVATAAAVLF